MLKNKPKGIEVGCQTMRTKFKDIGEFLMAKKEQVSILKFRNLKLGETFDLESNRNKLFGSLDEILDEKLNHDLEMFKKKREISGVDEFLFHT